MQSSIDTSLSGAVSRRPRAGHDELASEATLGGLRVGSSQIRRGLLYSLWDGIAATAMLALTDTFGVAAAVSLHAHDVAIALLGSLPLFLGAVGQYLLPAVVDLGRGRKPYILRAVGLQATGLLAAGLLPALLPSAAASWAYVLCFACAALASNVTAAAWTSWMGDLVAPEIRGRHFAWRSRVFALVNLSCALSVGLWAGRYTSSATPWGFFACILVAAGAFRFVSLEMMRRQHEPAPSRVEDRDWRAKPSRLFKRFCFANGVLQAATAMSSPFFTVWYLRDLHFSYLALALAGSTTVVGNIVSLPLWGSLVDRFGTSRVLKAAGVLVALVPLPYCLTGDCRAIWLLGVFSGVSWAGYNLASFNQLLGFSDKKNRAPLIAYAAVVSGVGVFALTLGGGTLAARLPILFRWKLQTLFLVSSVLRFAAVAALPSCEERAASGPLRFARAIPAGALRRALLVLLG